MSVINPVNNLRTEIEIAATPERIWNILTDFAAFPQWNPFIVQIEGKAIVGTKLKATMKPQGSKGMIFTPAVLEATPHREFRWLGRLFLPGLMDGEHRFFIEPIDEKRSRLIHEETFRGILVPLFMGMMREGTLAGFNAMNQALKTRAEGEG